jgi:hypothetical protein
MYTFSILLKIKLPAKSYPKSVLEKSIFHIIRKKRRGNKTCIPDFFPPPTLEN